LEAFPNDPNGLTLAVTNILDDHTVAFDWEDIKSRYRKFVDAVTNKKFNVFALTVAKHVPPGEQERFLNWINFRRQSNLKLHNFADASRQNSGDGLIRQEDLDFLKRTPTLAQPLPTANQPVPA